MIIANQLDTIARQALQVANVYGITRASGIKAQKVYEDDRIIITGQIGKEDTYDLLMIQIKLWTDQPKHVEKVFGLPARVNADQVQTTVVYFAKEPFKEPDFRRPGKWERYIEHLYNQIVDAKKQATSLNGVSVKDDDLFSAF